MRPTPFLAVSASLLWAALVAPGCSPRGSDGAAPQSGRTSTDWPMYRGDLAGTGYSPLSELTPENVSTLVQAWRYDLLRTPAHTVDEEAAARSAFSQATPIVVGDVMYLPSAASVVALDPTTGSELWQHTLEDGAPSRRGVAYWPGDGEAAARILFTSRRRLIALDAATGATVPAFGGGAGEIDMVVPYLSVPLVYENIVVVGANTPRGARGGIGNARAFDARTGEKLWEFSSVPAPGAVGHDTWAEDSWRDRLGVNAWPFYFTMDEERGLVFLPLAAPAPFAFGGDRAGANLFANSVVAVDIRSGEYNWHFQTIHHDLWDHDPPAPPVLFDITRDDQSIPALAVTTKSGYLYILNRETGEPIFGVEERPMPASDVPGEQTFLTQPIPTKPPALARTSYATADLVTARETSEEHVAACAALLESVGQIENAGPFTPWAYRPAGASSPTTLLFPGLVGGHNWGGVALDPGSHTLLVFSQDLGTFGWIEASTEGSALPYELKTPPAPFFDVSMGDQRWPCQKPPWGQLIAVDASTGTIVWQRPVGITKGLPPEKENTGRPGRAAAIVTAAGLVFVASTDDNRLRALDVKTGDELWVTEMEHRGNANPMTYLGADGHQYVALAATDQVLAFRLP